MIDSINSQYKLRAVGYINQQVYRLLTLSLFMFLQGNIDRNKVETFLHGFKAKRTKMVRVFGEWCYFFYVHFETFSSLVGFSYPLDTITYSLRLWYSISHFFFLKQVPFFWELSSPFRFFFKSMNEHYLKKKKKKNSLALLYRIGLTISKPYPFQDWKNIAV